MSNLNPTTLTQRSMPGKQAGFSLIELMIASVIGLVILGGAVTVFSSNSASSRMNTGMSRIQDNGRVALDIISYGTRMTGYDGCRDETKDAVTVLATNAPTIILPADAIWGAEVGDNNSWDPPLHPDLQVLAGRVKDNTDVLYIQHGSGRSTNLQSDMAAGVADIVLPSNPDQLAANDLVMISDCITTDIFRATGVTSDTTTGITTIAHGAAGNIQANFNTAYTGTGNMNAVAVRVMRFEANAYYVGDSGRDTPSGDDIFSLFVLDRAANPDGRITELVEGVENLQVLYGENMQPDAATPVIRYVPADQVTDTNNILSVQLGLLIATAEDAASTNDDRIYNIAGTSIGPPNNANTDDQHEGDRRIRAAFNTTIQLRNRSLQGS